MSSAIFCPVDRRILLIVASIRPSLSVHDEPGGYKGMLLSRSLASYLVLAFIIFRNWSCRSVGKSRACKGWMSYIAGISRLRTSPFPTQRVSTAIVTRSSTSLALASSVLCMSSPGKTERQSSSGSLVTAITVGMGTVPGRRLRWAPQTIHAVIAVTITTTCMNKRPSSRPADAGLLRRREHEHATRPAPADTIRALPDSR